MINLINQLHPDDLILTPNRRLAASLRKQYQDTQIKQGKLVWPTLPIMPLTSWLESTWIECTQHAISPPLLLTAHQEQILWEEIIRQSPASQHLLQVSRTAKLAQSAWELLKQWKVDLADPALSSTEDSDQFQQWAKEFQKKCRQHNWIDRASLADLIGKQLEKITLVKNITLVGFIEISPQIRCLLDLLETHRCHSYVSTHARHCEPSASRPRNDGHELLHSRDSENNNSHRDERIRRITLSDKQNEITTMARWAKKLYEENAFNNTTIGCIVPELESDRDTIQKIFTDVFAVSDAISLPFNISAGKKLATCPIIYTALQILNLSADRITLEQLSHLLRSPFIGDAEKESQKRAFYDNYLRSLNLSSVSLKKLLAKNNPLKFLDYCPLLAKRFNDISIMAGPQSGRGNPDKMTHSQWATYFNNMLQVLGWPGERSVNSEEYQIIQNGWLPLLNEFSKLDAVLPSLNQAQALHYLTQLAESTIFQPKTPEAPIQILGTLEAAGLSFDYLWFMGLDDTQWPKAPSPNPFIPSRLQKKLNMPNASPDRELAYSEKLTRQFIESSGEVIFSHSKQNEQSILRPSALIKPFPVIEINQLALSEFISEAERIYQTQAIEQIEDNNGPKLPENDITPGGVNLFKLQAACPFKAFAEIRLNARFLESPTTGLRALDRGKIIHKILELIWKELKGSEQLHALDNDALHHLISDSIKKSFEHISLIQNNEENARYLLIEKSRLEKLIIDWLVLEKKRPPFRVLACEQEQEITLGPCQVKLRIDRIDELNEGEQLVIDYKTGNNNQIKGWFGARPDEPQMPLYCITDPIHIIGITFAELHPDSLEFKGISKMSLAIPTIKPIAEIKQSDALLWAEQINQWRNVLTQLGNDFYQGIAHVDPKNPDETCRQCHLHSLCRIYETY